jgi:hypothetical protein
MMRSPNYSGFQIGDVPVCLGETPPLLVLHPSENRYIREMALALQSTTHIALIANSLLKDCVEVQKHP